MQLEAVAPLANSTALNDRSRHRSAAQTDQHAAYNAIY